MPESWRPRQSRDERVSRHLLSMAHGAVGGRVAQAAPPRPERRSESGTGDVAEAVFSTHTAPVPGDESPPYYNTMPKADLGTVIAATRSLPSTDTVISFLVNGTAKATLTLPAGQKTAEEVVEDVMLEYGDMLTVVVSPVGSGLSGLTVHALLSE